MTISIAFSPESQFTVNIVGSKTHERKDNFSWVWCVFIYAYVILKTTLRVYTPPLNLPLSIQLVFSVFPNIHQEQLIVSTYFYMCGLPFKCGWPAKGYTLKENQLCLSQNQSLINSSSTRSVKSCPKAWEVVIYWHNQLAVGLLFCLLSRIAVIGSPLRPLTCQAIDLWPR